MAEKWQDITLRLIIVLAAITSVVHVIWKSFPDWALTVIIFLAIFAILIQLGQIGGTIRSVEKQIKESATHNSVKHEDIISKVDDDTRLIQSIKHILADRTHVKVYNNYQEFYRDLRTCAENARNEIKTSYMRRFPPGSLGGEAELYFNSIVEWALRDPNHLLRRVVCKPEGGLLAWVQGQDTKSQVKDSHYRIRILDWTVRDVDAISVAVIDEDLVFFVFSGTEESMKGFSIRNRDVAGYFTEYYNAVWHSSVPLKDFISNRQR